METFVRMLYICLRLLPLLFFVHVDAGRVIGKVAADNVCDVFVDGRYLTATRDISRGHKVTFDDSVKVIGLRAIDFGGLGGVIASFDDGIVTDSSWKCTNDVTDDRWAYPDYDDSKWPYATHYNRQPDPKRPIGISKGARWIWTKGYHAEDQIIYCRKRRNA